MALPLAKITAETTKVRVKTRTSEPFFDQKRSVQLHPPATYSLRKCHSWLSLVCKEGR